METLQVVAQCVAASVILYVIVEAVKAVVENFKNVRNQ